MVDKEKKAELRAKLKTLNEAVAAAVKARTEWMDAHMEDFAEYKVGETLYDMNTGRELGVVSRLYRFWGPQSQGGPPRDERYDTDMGVYYELKVGENSYDNTSRHGSGLWLGNAKERAGRFRY